MLNKKLIQLDRLELENEHLKMKIDQLQEAEIQAVDDRERILNLQRVVADRELEIRKMVRHIEELSEGVRFEVFMTAVFFEVKYKLILLP